MLCKSLLIWFAVTFRSVAVENNDVSSASNFGFETRLSGRSLKKKSKDPSIEPWETPA